MTGRASSGAPTARQAAERQAAERQAAERQAAERQAAERQAAERQAAERQAAERQAAERQAAERQAAGRHGRRSPPETPGSGPNTLWNPLAYSRGELLSDELAPDVLADRWARRYDGAVGEINRWVDEVRATTYENVPYADPAAAADGARVLVLLQDPDGDADEGSGFVSKHNNDVTSYNTYRVTERAKLDHGASLHWNVVPWWVANPSRPPRSLLREADRAQPYLVQFLERLDPAPTEVVLMGRAAGRAWDRFVRRGLPSRLAGVTVGRCPHPSPLVYPRHHAATGRGNSDLMVEALRVAGQRSRGERVRAPVGGPAGRRRPV